MVLLAFLGSDFSIRGAHRCPKLKFTFHSLCFQATLSFSLLPPFPGSSKLFLLPRFDRKSFSLTVALSLHKRASTSCCWKPGLCWDFQEVSSWVTSLEWADQLNNHLGTLGPNRPTGISLMQCPRTPPARLCSTKAPQQETQTAALLFRAKSEEEKLSPEESLW